MQFSLIYMPTRSGIISYNCHFILTDARQLKSLGEGRGRAAALNQAVLSPCYWAVRIRNLLLEPLTPLVPDLYSKGPNTISYTYSLVTGA